MKKSVYALVGSALALTLAACGGNAADSEAPGDGDAAATASDVLATDLSGLAKDEAVAALVPEAVSEDGKLTIGTNIFYAPAEFYASDGTTPQGFDIDLMNALAKVMGLEVDIQQADFNAIFPAIGTNYEAAIASITVNEDRLAQFNMIQYFEDGNSWSVAKGNPNGFDPAQKCGAAIGVQTGTYQDEVLTAVNEGECASDPITIQRYDTQNQATQTLAAGQLDAMYTDSSVAAYAAKLTEGATEILGEPEEVSGRAITVAKDDKELTDALVAATQSLIDSGDLAKIFETWGITEGVPTEALLNPGA